MTASSTSVRYLRTRLPYVLVIVWLLAMFVLYYVVHNPLDSLTSFSFPAFASMLGNTFSAPEAGRRILNALWLNLIDTAAVAILVATAGGLGGLILPAGRSVPEYERPVLQALLGLGALAIVVLVAGMLGLFPPVWLAWVITIVVAGMLYRQIVNWGRAFAASCRELLWPSAGALSRWLQWAVLILIALPFLVSLVPPFQWDALTYHLEGPRLYLAAGRIVSFPENHFLGFPQTVEMLYLWLMIVARANGAGLLHWVFSLMAILLTVSLARRSGHPEAGVLAAAGLLVCDSLWAELTWPYNDMALVAFVVAALCMILTWAEAQTADRLWLLIRAGLFVGLQMGTKYTAAGLAIGAAFLVGWLAKKDGIGAVLRACVLLTALAVVVLSPWLIKNAILDGNPVSPFIWGTSAFDQVDQAYYLRSGTGLGAISVIFAPIQATVFGREQVAPYGGSAGVLVFTLLPLALLGWNRRGQLDRDLITRLAIFCIPPYLIWLYGVATSWYLVQTRLLYPIFPTLILIGAVGSEGLRAQRPSLDPSLFARLIAAAACLIAVFGALLGTMRNRGWLAELGLISTDDYLVSQLGHTYTAFQQINTLPETARVQMMWEPRTYYCNITCIPDSGIDRWWHDRQLEPDPHKIVAGWRASGITHVLIADGGLGFMMTDPIESQYEPLTQADMDALDAARQKDMTLVWSLPGSYSLYEIAP